MTMTELNNEMRGALVYFGLMFGEMDKVTVTIDAEENRIVFSYSIYVLQISLGERNQN